MLIIGDMNYCCKYFVEILPNGAKISKFSADRIDKKESAAILGFSQSRVVLLFIDLYPLFTSFLLACEGSTSLEYINF